MITINIEDDDEIKIQYILNHKLSVVKTFDYNEERLT